MRLVTFRHAGLEKPGALVAGAVADLSALGASLTAIIERQPSAKTLSLSIAEAPRIALADISLAAPIPTPRRNIMCVGKNYAAHAREFASSGFDASASAQDPPSAAIIFTKAPSSVTGPDSPVMGSLDFTNSVDYEGELAVVMGRGGRGITRETALEHVFGYTIVNDVTSRQLQQTHKQWFLGKSIDTFCPMGPAIVTADEIPNPRVLRLQTRVNGELRQDAAVEDLIFDIPVLIETLSRTLTLAAGDIIATGTPEGVGIGFKPPRFLARGDQVEVTIEPIGTLRNTIA